MTKLTKEFVDSLDLQLINVSDVLNDTTLNNMSTTQNSQNDSPQKAERSISQNWERESPQKSDSNSTLTEQNSPNDDENGAPQNTELTTPDSEEKSFQNLELSYSETSEQQVTPEPQNTELTTPDPEEKSFQNSELSSSQNSEQQVTPNGAEPDEALSEKGVTLENTKDDNLLEIASPKPIDETLKEIVFEKDINYVGTLQELCVKKQLTPPLYGLEKIDGPPHCPTFQTFCEVGPHRQVVTSANKKMGKQLAAAKVLECIKMDSDLPDYASSQPTLTNVISTTSNITSNTTASEIDEKVTAIANPVGYLQEWCVKNRITPPKYGIEKIEGPPHCPIFHTFCEVDQHREIVSSKSKKTGKDLVARKIIMLLK